MIFILAPIATLLSVLLLLPIVRNRAVRSGFVDAPGGRKQHERPVPPIGGLVIFFVFIVASLLVGFDFKAYWPLYAALILLLALGTLDDRGDVRAVIKFGIQFVAAFLIVGPGGAQLVNLGHLFGGDIIALGWFSWPLSLFCVVLLINSINLMDGLDGLAAGMSFVVLFWLLVASEVWGSSLGAPISVLMACVAGFLFYNMRHPWRKRAGVFLGDAGSMCLGLCLAWFCIHAGQAYDAPQGVLIEASGEEIAPYYKFLIEPVSIAWIIALPVMDACGQFFRRMKEGRHPFSPDRGHFHHHFVDTGVSVEKTTPIILCIGFVLGGIGYVGFQAGLHPAVLSIGWVGLLALHMVISLKPDRFRALIAQLIK